jgi:hypothetical protein
MGDGEACHRCHFDEDPVTDSPALHLEGVSAPIAPGARYDLALKFEPGDAAAAGFLMIARAVISTAGEDETAPLGVFEAIGEGVEANGAAVRSTTSSAADMTWRAAWIAPETLDGPVVFDVVANAANDDLSPFGDVIHLATFVVEAANEG